MRTLVTGGAGFIGSHLCEALLARGEAVLCVDNLITGARGNIEHLLDRDGFEFLVHDVIQPLPGAVVGDVHRIYHFASPASPVGYRGKPVETMLVNTVGTTCLLRLAADRGARFLFASTSEVYGDPLRHPQDEDYWGNVNPIGMRACYDEAKRFGETLTVEWRRVYGVDSRIVRIFNTYGPRNQLDDGRVVPNFLTQAIRGEPLTVYGDGMQTRSFTFVTDLVDGILRAMDSEDTGEEVFNLGNPEEYTILQFADAVLKATGSRSPVEHRPLLFADDPFRRRPDISRATSRLGWKPTTSLAAGLGLTVPWYREQLGA